MKKNINASRFFEYRIAGFFFFPGNPFMRDDPTTGKTEKNQRLISDKPAVINNARQYINFSQRRTDGTIDSKNNIGWCSLKTADCEEDGRQKKKGQTKRTDKKDRQKEKKGQMAEKKGRTGGKHQATVP